MSQTKFPRAAIAAIKQHRPALMLSRGFVWRNISAAKLLVTEISHPTKTIRPFSVGTHFADVQARGGEQTTIDASTHGQRDLHDVKTPIPTIASIRQRRNEAGRLIAPTASSSNSDMFKDPEYQNLPKAQRWDNHLTAEALSRQPPVLKQAVKALGKPGLISLGGGIPTAKNFPIEKLKFRVPTGQHGFSEAETEEYGELVTIGKYDVLNASTAIKAKEEAQEILDKGELTADTFNTAGPTSKKTKITKDAEYDLSIALNYSQSTGAAQLLRFVTEHTELVSNPPYADWRCSLTIGSTGALEQAFRMLLDGHRGDSLLTEEFSFATALETARPLGVGAFGIPMDEQGLIPEAMDEILTTWDEKSRGGKRKPHVLYTVPSGQNPTGATQGTQRRQNVYEVCKKHDVFIIEDEPYYFLNMPAYNPSSSPSFTPSTAARSSGVKSAERDPAAEDFLASLPPTLLSLDTDGRVLRLDSFSKTLIPGSRVGWITASEQITEQYVRHAECASQGPSGISQLVLHKLVDETWGHDGFLRWLSWLAGEYTKRRDVLIGACERELGSLRGGDDGKSLVKWTVPRAGMFLWLEIDHTAHPDIATKPILEIEEEVYEACISHGVLACRGSWFRAEPEKPLTGLFFRTTYAAAPEDDMAKAVERFGRAVREVFRIQG